MQMLDAFEKSKSVEVLLMFQKNKTWRTTDLLHEFKNEFGKFSYNTIRSRIDALVELGVLEAKVYDDSRNLEEYTITKLGTEVTEIFVALIQLFK